MVRGQRFRAAAYNRIISGIRQPGSNLQTIRLCSCAFERLFDGAPLEVPRQGNRTSQA